MRTHRGTLVAATLVVVLAGCAAPVTKVESGERGLGERMLVSLDDLWNKVSEPDMETAEVWTMEGRPVDQLLIYSGIKNEQVIHATAMGANRKDFAFRSGMQPDEIVAMFEGMLTRDGSTFKLVKLAPADFGGAKGFRFEYALTRKIDNVQLSGLGFGTVSNGELFALLYQAPRLAFFPRHQPPGEPDRRADQADGRHHGDEDAEPDAVVADAGHDRQDHRHRDEDGAHFLQGSAEDDVQHDHREHDRERRELRRLHPDRKLVRQAGEHDEAREDEGADDDEKQHRARIHGLEKGVAQPAQAESARGEADDNRREGADRCALGRREPAEVNAHYGEKEEQKEHTHPAPSPRR